MTSAAYTSDGNVEEAEGEPLIAEQQQEAMPQSTVALPSNKLVSNINQASSGSKTLNESTGSFVVKTQMAVEATDSIDMKELRLRVSDWDSNDSMYAAMESALSTCSVSRGDNSPTAAPIVTYRNATVSGDVARLTVASNKTKIHPESIRYDNPATRPRVKVKDKAIYCLPIIRTAGEFGVGLTSSSQNDTGPKPASEWQVNAHSGSDRVQLLPTGEVHNYSPAPASRAPAEAPISRPEESNNPSYARPGWPAYAGALAGPS